MRFAALIAPALFALAALPYPAAAQMSYEDAVGAEGRLEAHVAQDANRNPAETLEFLGVEAGDVVVDVAPGTGYFSEIMARIVGPEGLVVGIQSSVGDGRMHEPWVAVLENNANVRLDIMTPEMLVLPANSTDFVMMSLAYHDVYFDSEEYGHPRQHPQMFLAGVYEALRPGGIVGVIEHVAEPGGDVREVVHSLHRIDPAVVRADFEAAGFVFDGESDILRNPEDDHSLLVFRPEIRGHTDRVLYRFRKPE